jgi:uncharacterized protein (DUF488 family)
MASAHRCVGMVSCMPQLATIGVYGFTLEEFLGALAEARVVKLLDVRQRRGVRGAEYSWANAQRLQAALHDAGIAYEHHLELAPTTELRQVQYAEDDRRGVGKRSRTRLAFEYAERYEHEILDHVDLAPIVAAMPVDGATALFCVESAPSACHRSIVARRLAEEFDVPVLHVLPPEPNPRGPRL